MALRSNEILETFVSRLIQNKDIMDILNLPMIDEKDSIEVKNKKRRLLIDKAITKSSQEPVNLTTPPPPITIGNKEYTNYTDTRITVSLAQSIKMSSYLFGNPQVDINIYYDNTKMNNVFKLLDLISDEFSGQDLIVQVDENKQMIKSIKCEGITAQVAIINNYERVGIRFSFYATLYKN